MPRDLQKRTSKSNSPQLHIILLDQEPLRRTAADDCAEAMWQLERARAGWHRYEREDRPAFVRWRAREFGTLLSRARDVEVQIRDGQALIHEVEMEMRRGFQDAHSAYQRVMFRRENPSAAAPPEPEAKRDGDAGARRLSEFEQEALFQEWVQRSLGTNPDKMDDEAYSTSFEAFKTHMFRGPTEERPAQHYSRQGPRERSGRAEEDDEPQEESMATTVDLRVKELYRVLVRRLHPDLRGDGIAAASALWHEVQEAYLANDVARMELLLALSDIESHRLREQTTLSQMRTVCADLQRAVRALEKSLQEAEGEEAWNFARVGPSEDLRLRVQRQLKSDLAARTLRLDLLTRTLAAWAAGPVANRKIVPGRTRQFA